MTFSCLLSIMVGGTLQDKQKEKASILAFNLVGKRFIVHYTANITKKTEISATNFRDCREEEFG